MVALVRKMPLARLLRAFFLIGERSHAGPKPADAEGAPVSLLACDGCDGLRPLLRA
jgi:hypothetical protein